MIWTIAPPDVRKAARRLLSPGERDVLMMRADGASYEFIRRRLGISAEKARRDLDAALVKVRAEIPGALAGVEGRQVPR